MFVSLGKLELGSIQWFLVKKINGRVITVDTDDDEIKSTRVRSVVTLF